MNTGFLNIPFVVWGGLALVVAVIFALFTPYQAALGAATGVSFLILRWGHSLVWVLIAVQFFLRAAGRPEWNGIANLIGAAGGITYLIFIVTLTSQRGA